MPDKLLQILAIGWCFSSFLQGPSGFGVPVAVAAPLLIGIGVRPLWAVIITLMAHAWGNLFGTLALGWDALIQQVPLSGEDYWQTAWWSALLTGALSIMAGIIICWQFYGWRGFCHGLPAIIVIGTIHCAGQVICSQLIPELSVILPTTLALGSLFLLNRLPRYRSAQQDFTSPIMRTDLEAVPLKAPLLSLHQALLPYYLLVALSIMALMLEPVNTFLGQWQSGFALPATRTGYDFINPAQVSYSPIAWLTHSGFFLLCAALMAAFYYLWRGWLSPAHYGSMLRQTWNKFLPSAVSISCLLIMSKVMSGSGQIQVLADGTAAVTGVWYACLAPAVGTLGSFMASSSVNSNILFAQFQETMARLSHKSIPLILAAQGAGSAVGTMISPSKVLLAMTTTGTLGEESQVFSRLLRVALAVSNVMGIVIYALA